MTHSTSMDGWTWDRGKLVSPPRAALISNRKILNIDIAYISFDIRWIVYRYYYVLWYAAHMLLFKWIRCTAHTHTHRTLRQVCHFEWTQKLARVINSILSHHFPQSIMIIHRFSTVCCFSLFIFRFVYAADVYAFLVVFVLPLNSAVNPILYTFTTPKYRNQVLLRGWNKLTSRKLTRNDGSGHTGSGSNHGKYLHFILNINSNHLINIPDFLI